MTPKEYQSLALRTMAPLAKDRSYSPKEQQMLNGALGLSGETGELVDYMKKVFFHGHDLDVNKVADEAGDVLWYMACLLDAFDLDMEQVMIQNVEKLKKRYPQGFTKEGSLHG